MSGFGDATADAREEVDEPRRKRAELPEGLENGRNPVDDIHKLRREPEPGKRRDDRVRVLAAPHPEALFREVPQIAVEQHVGRDGPGNLRDGGSLAREKAPDASRHRPPEGVQLPVEFPAKRAGALPAGQVFLAARVVGEVEGLLEFILRFQPLDLRRIVL